MRGRKLSQEPMSYGLTAQTLLLIILLDSPLVHLYFWSWLFFGSQRISFLSLVKNCNHKGLGIYYLLSAFIFGISGTLISVLIRIELYSSGNRIISPDPC